jgi:hypothetical protein
MIQRTIVNGKMPALNRPVVVRLFVSGGEFDAKGREAGVIDVKYG